MIVLKNISKTNIDSSYNLFERWHNYDEYFTRILPHRIGRLGIYM